MGRLGFCYETQWHIRPRTYSHAIVSLFWFNVSMQTPKYRTAGALRTKQSLEWGWVNLQEENITSVTRKIVVHHFLVVQDSFLNTKKAKRPTTWDKAETELKSYKRPIGHLFVLAIEVLSGLLRSRYSWGYIS